MIRNINNQLLKTMIIEAANVLEINKENINKLNVFPVPDADTGTNMYLTLKSAKDILIQTNIDDISINQLLELNSNALLKGAKGNSGSILSLIFRGIMKTITKYEHNENLTCDLLAQAFFKGSELAYNAVMNPVDGTMLTVCKIAAKKCIDNCSRFKNINDFFDYFIHEAQDELEKTQYKNSILKKAGVVDAGAYGFLCILKGMRNALTNNIHDEIQIKNEIPINNNLNISSLENIKYIYCTEAIIEKFKSNDSNFKENISKYGDSIVILEENKFIKFHIHTNVPNKILSFALNIGMLSCIKIDNMKKQHNESDILLYNNKIIKTEITDNINIYFNKYKKNFFDVYLNNKLLFTKQQNFFIKYKTNIINHIIELCKNHVDNSFIIEYVCDENIFNQFLNQLKEIFPDSEYIILNNNNIINKQYINIMISEKKCI